MTNRTVRLRARRLVAIASVAIMVTTGCGARLTQAQIKALSNTGSGSGGGTGTGGSGLSATGGGSNVTTGGATSAGCVTTPATKKGATTPATKKGATTPATKKGARTTSTTPLSCATSSGGTQGHVVAVAGSGGSRAATGGGGRSGGGGSGTGPVVVANDPLAGPGGRVCPTGAAGSGPGVTATTITIGNIATINGPVPGLFAGARAGTQAFADWANSLGGLCGRKLVVNSADDNFDQATDQSLAAQMANQVLSFVGSFSLQDSGIPGGAPGVPDVGQTLTSARFHSTTEFAPQPTPPGFTTGAYKFFATNPATRPGTQHLAMLVENTPQTIITGKWEQDALQSLGYHFAFVDTNLQPTDPNFNNDVPIMAQKGITGVIFQATGTIVGQLARAMYQAGMHLSFGNYVATAYDPAYIQNAGPGTAGTVLEQQLAMYQGEDAATVPMVATFDQWYSRVNPGQTPDLYAAYGWLSGLLFAQGLNAGGAPTRAALLNGLHQITAFNGGGMSAASDPATKTPASCWIAIDVSNGKFVRDPATPSGFRCSPSGYYREPGG